MSVRLVQDRLDSYHCQSSIEEELAIREITQEVALAALGRTEFFKHAVFQGGTCLRILYGLNRFSEDMDFLLKEPSLFAGKLHALLCREYVKGRDWYDFLWYTSQEVRINYEFLSSALRQQGPWQYQEVQTNLEWCLEHLESKIRSVDWPEAREDIRRFVKAGEQPSLELWSADLFLSQLRKIKG